VPVQYVQQVYEEPVQYIEAPQEEYFEDFEPIMEYQSNKSKVLRMPRKATEKTLKSQPMVADQDFTQDDWSSIQKKID
jgi:hypothetical protein